MNTAPSSHSGNDLPPALIELNSVNKVYGRDKTMVRALNNVDMCIRKGEFVAVMGASGSGKSTCMNLVGCLDSPTSGSYYFSGVDVRRLSRDQRALLRRNFIGFVFQGFNLLDRTSAQENVELPLIYRGLAADERRMLARKALEAVGLDGRENHTPAELSGGQQQRVAIARAIVTEPSVLLADEPTGNLDTKRSHEFMQLLSKLNRDRGLTVIIVTHEDNMAAYARRVISFVDGDIESDKKQAGSI